MLLVEYLAEMGVTHAQNLPCPEKLARLSNCYTLLLISLALQASPTKKIFDHKEVKWRCLHALCSDRLLDIQSSKRAAVLHLPEKLTLTVPHFNTDVLPPASSLCNP